MASRQVGHPTDLVGGDVRLQQLVLLQQVVDRCQVFAVVLGGQQGVHLQRNTKGLKRSIHYLIPYMVPTIVWKKNTKVFKAFCSRVIYISICMPFFLHTFGDDILLVYK